MASAKQATVGDNRKAEERRKILFFDHCAKRMAVDAKIAELKADRKKLTGVAKADGIAAKSLDFAITAITAHDEQSFIDNFIHNGEILEWCGMFPGFQADLFKGRMPADERIQKAGELAGFTNRPRESGYAADSRETQIWLKAYDAATLVRNENLAAALEEAEKTRQSEKDALLKGKPGRPKKAKAGEPLTGDTPDDDAKQKAANQNGEQEAKAVPPKPPAPSAVDKPEEEMTNAERETVRNARAMFN